MPETTSLFNKIAKHYDSLNTFFSFGMDKLWRRKLVHEIEGSDLVLDIATGTGEVAIEAIKKLQRAQVVGIDPSSEMLRMAKPKCEVREYKNKIKLVQGYAEQLPFTNDTFDAITIAFGIRNTVNPLESLTEMNRVLKPGGKLAILEFTIPKNAIFAPIYLFYFRKFLPFIGSFFGSQKEYKYLSDSTSEFPQRGKFIEIMNKAEFTTHESIELMIGTVIIYRGIKNQ
ncbi:MAG: bifunctional demethylmenaquinone methyltransferase/2-methoxy-6-polyprenyl-1,4-benzoquinol methylase UbiE [Thermodesulfobacteriota bacterium]